jgi:hypothetical protein
MEQKFVKYLHDFFKIIIELYGFKIKEEINDGRYYMIEYSSKNFVIKIEKYFREFYLTLYKNDFLKQEINIFNLLDYLNRDFLPFEYFYEEFSDKNELEKYYIKQFNYLSKVVVDNFTTISNFFRSKDYELKIADLEKFMINKYPELFKRN